MVSPTPTEADRAPEAMSEQSYGMLLPPSAEVAGALEIRFAAREALPKSDQHCCSEGHVANPPTKGVLTKRGPPADETCRRNRRATSRLARRVVRARTRAVGVTPSAQLEHDSNPVRNMIQAGCMSGCLVVTHGPLRSEGPLATDHGCAGAKDCPPQRREVG